MWCKSELILVTLCHRKRAAFLRKLTTSRQRSYARKCSPFPLLISSPLIFFFTPHEKYGLAIAVGLGWLRIISRVRPQHRVSFSKVGVLKQGTWADQRGIALAAGSTTRLSWLFPIAAPMFLILS